MGRGPAAPEVDDTTSRDSMLVSAGTALARATGVARVVVIGAVLGPTTFGNAFQVTNSLPNLVYYGFLAGSLVSSLLVPALVRHLHGTDPYRVARLARGFLGVVLAGSALTLPVLVLGLPWLLRLAAWGAGGGTAGRHLGLVTALAAFTAPQVLLYALAGTGSAVMYANRRFVLPACAPALENLGLIAVFGICAATYGIGHDVGGAGVATGEVMLLGFGSTAAVGLHAGLQWWGARRCGVTLVPARGWTDPDVRAVVSRALRSMSQAGLLATQTLAMLLVLARVPGGVVALQIALNFYFLPLALIATPVGLAVLPRLSRLHQSGDASAFWDACVRALMLGLFLVLPAAAGYVALAGPIAHAVGAGAMASSQGLHLVAGALAMLSLGLPGAAVFFIATQACYARDDPVRPLRSMTVQAAVCLLLVGLAAALAPDRQLVPAVAAAYAVGCLAGATHLFAALTAGVRSAVGICLRSVGRVLAGTLAMLPVVVVVGTAVTHVVPGRLGALAAVLAGTATGTLAFVGSQSLLGAPELQWLRSAVRNRAVPLEVGAG